MLGFDIVETELGNIRGVKKVSALGTPWNPLPPEKWEHIYDATVEKIGSYGENFYTKKIVGSEDCLHINIFTKHLNPKRLQPVMMYLHGGSFITGSNTMNLLSPDFLLMADVVIVTINYRLGALGFLSLPDQSLNVPGNAAMKDQVMAMKFVQKNIRHFGGDPNNCCLFGHSAGGASVSWHCVSELSKGLLQKAIIMSGCVLNKYAFTPNRDWANRLARKLGYDGDESDKNILEFLNQVDPVKIVEVQETLILPEEKSLISYSFAPHIEPYINSETFNSELPINLVRKAWSNDIDILLGLTSDEGLMVLEYLNQSPTMLKMVKLENMAPAELLIPADDPIRVALAEKLKQIYYPLDTDPTEDFMAYGQVSLFTSFATTGNPNGNIIDADLSNAQWHPVDTLDPPYKCLNLEADNVKFEIFPHSERLDVWDWVYHQTNSPLY